MVIFRFLTLACLLQGRLFTMVTEEHLPDNQQQDIGGLRTTLEPYNTTNFRAGEAFDVVYEWKVMDMQFETVPKRAEALHSGSFVPKNLVPLGLDVYKDRLFITTPRWGEGVPASLSSLPAKPTHANETGFLKPYPCLEAHSCISTPNCDKLISVHRTEVDGCHRLWALDSGLVGMLPHIKQVCPPKVVVFDLDTDKQVASYKLPADHVQPGSLYTNIVVDTRSNACDDVFAYLFDVHRYAVAVVSLKQNTSWLTTSHLYLPDPQASDFTFEGMRFQITDGAFGGSLTEVNAFGDRILFYHPLSSNMEFFISTAVLRNQSYWTSFAGQAEAATAFNHVGSRGPYGQASTAGISCNGVQFFNLVQRSSVGCWDTRKPYTKANLGEVESNPETINFPNDMKLDQHSDPTKQNLWVLSNRLPKFLFGKLNPEEVNFRVLRVCVDAAIKGTICDPKTAHIPPTIHECSAGDYPQQ